MRSGWALGWPEPGEVAHIANQERRPLPASQLEPGPGNDGHSDQEHGHHRHVRHRDIRPLQRAGQDAGDAQYREHIADGGPDDVAHGDVRLFA